MPKFMQEVIATIIAGGYLALLVASFFLFSMLTFVALLILPFLLCIPFFVTVLKPRGTWKIVGPQQRYLTKDEAYKILGLDPLASPEDVMERHKRLIAMVHPDRGGSTYLVQLIHEAKTVIMTDFAEQRSKLTERKF